MSAFELDPGEGIIKEEGAMYLKSVLNAQRGRLYLTTKRVLFLKAVNSIQSLVGVSAVVCNIPRGAVKGISQSNQGFNKNVLVISVSNGSQYRFLVNDYSSWTMVL